MADEGGVATLRFSDREVREVVVSVGSTVLTAAHAAGVNLISQCKGGTCLTCVGTVVDGDVAMPEGLVTALSPAEIESGQRLLCQSIMHGDATIGLDYPSMLLEANPPVEFEAKIASVEWVAASVVELKVRAPKSLKFSFQAGQYCRFKVPGSVEWRSYSMASGEHQRGTLSFLVRVLPSGQMSDYLRNHAAVGDRIQMEGPLGRFAYDPEVRPHLLVAGGTGLAPMLSILDKIRLNPASPPVQLIFGCVREADLFFLDEIEARKSFMPNLSVLVTVEERSSDAAIGEGNPVQAIANEHVADGTVAYICGPPGMIRAATDRLRALGLDPTSIRAEQFVAS